MNFRILRYSNIVYLLVQIAVFGAGVHNANAANIYVDGQITPTSCTEYDTSLRNCGSGADVAYKTLSGATTVAGPGNTVFIREGTYNEALIPQNSGAPGSYITYRNFNSEVVKITGASLSPGIDISNRSYLVIEGLEITNVRRWMYALNAHYNIVRNNAFRLALDSGGSGKTGLFFQEATYNKILNNIIEDSTADNLSLVKSDRNLV